MNTASETSPVAQSEQAISHSYRHDGYVAPVTAISAAEAQAILAEISVLRARSEIDAEAVLRHKPHLVLPTIASLIRDPRITDKVAEILGPDILCWTTNLFDKKPGDGKRVSWHQDGTYWGLTSNEVVTAWIALTDSSPENGCLRVIPGSHTWRQQPHRDTYAADNLLTRGQEIAVQVDEKSAVNIILAPGEMSLHDVMIAHASEPNSSDRPRTGIAIRYIATSVGQASGFEDSATLVRGDDKYGHFRLEPRPAALAHPNAIEEHNRAVAETRRILMRSTDDEQSRQGQAKQGASGT